MKLKVDQQADALYLTLNGAPRRRSEEVSPGIIVNYDYRNLYLRQVFFSMACFDKALSRLDSNLKAEIDPDRIRTY